MLAPALSVEGVVGAGSKDPAYEDSSAGSEDPAYEGSYRRV